jgi:hypothetical protein
MPKWYNFLMAMIFGKRIASGVYHWRKRYWMLYVNVLGEPTNKSGVGE